jgi:protein SCO1/2
VGRGVPRRPLLVIGCLLVASLALGACRRAPEPLPELGRVTPFALVDQAGRPTTEAALRGKVWVAAFLFTRCPTVCPALVAAMKSLESEASAQGLELAFVGFSVDPEHDTPPVLAAFAQANALSSSFTLLTGDLAVIERAADGFKIAVEGRADASADHFGILHGAHLVLVDRDLTLRGHYRVREPAERARLLADVRRLAP